MPPGTPTPICVGCSSDARSCLQGCNRWMAVSFQITSPTAIGLTPPFGLRSATSLEARTRRLAASGRKPFARSWTICARPRKHSSLAARTLRWLPPIPDGPDALPLSRRRTWAAKVSSGRTEITGAFAGRGGITLSDGTDGCNCFSVSNACGSS